MTEIKRTSQNKPLQRQGESVSPLSRYSNSPSYGVRTEEVISQTLADVIQNVIVGAVKSLEGIADVGQTIVGGIGGIFDSGFRDQIQKNVAYDWTMETFGNDWENQLRNSALNNNKVGGFVENVAQGVGGMLPAVAVTLATGGLGAPAAVGQALSLGTMATGAAGQSTQEAYQEGAGYLQGALYGAASGAIEAATEKMFGGVSSAIYGKGIMDGTVKSVGRSVGESALKQTAKRIGKEALEEGVEEVVSELASPLAKTIYKGGDALKEYGNPEYWKGVAEAGLAGSATALAYAGTIGYGMSKIRRGGKPLNYVGKEANIAEAVESIETEKERILKMADNSKISEKALKTTQENIKAYYADIQANLTSMSEKARSQAISDMSLEKAFNPDGTMTEDFSKQLDYDGGISEGTETPKAKYHSLNMSAEDVDKAISNNNAKAMTDSFTEEEEISYREFKKAFGKLRRASGNNLKYVVVDSMKDGNAYFDPETNAIVIGRDQMGKMNENISDAWKQSIVHEAFHFSQGTKSASKVISKLLDSDDVANEIFNDMAARGYDTAIVKKYLSGEDMNAEETKKFNEFRDEFESVLVEHALGNDAFISKLVRDDITTAQRILNAINDAKEVFTKDKKIRKAERMYLKAVEEAGMTYEGRKILAKKEEDDEERNERAKESLDPSVKNITDNVQTDANGDLVSVETKQGNVLMSQKTYDKTGKRVLRNLLQKNGFESAEIDSTLKVLDDVSAMLKELAKDNAALFNSLNAEITIDPVTGKAIYHAFVNNSDYVLNIDLSTICKKRIAFQNVLNRLVEEGLFDRISYDADAIADINEILRNNNLETACAICFVEAKRLQIQKWAKNIVDDYNGMASALGATEYFDFAKGGVAQESDIDAAAQMIEENPKELSAKEESLGGKSPNERINRQMKANPELRYLLKTSDLLTPEGLKNLRAKNKYLYSYITSRWGVATPKIVQSHNPYNSEIGLLSYDYMTKVMGKSVPEATAYKNWAKEELKKSGSSATPKEVAEMALRKYINDIGGIRIQSFSDFMVEDTFDYMQIVADLYARAYTMHGYTKEISCARLFGMTGQKWNMSVIMKIDPNVDKDHAGLTRQNGKWVYTVADYETYAKDKANNFVNSIGWKDAIALQLDPRYSGNVGTIAVGFSREHILKMLDDPLIRMVIPYHRSGIMRQFAIRMNVDLATDYTRTQETSPKDAKLYDGSALEIKFNEETGKATLPDGYSYDGFKFNESLRRHNGDAKAAAKEYLEWCEKGTTLYEVKNRKRTAVGTVVFNPKFEEFKKHENYYKLLEDFNTYDSVTGKPALQNAVLMQFPGALGEEGGLTAKQLEEYKERLRGTGIFSEEEIEKYAKKQSMSFAETLQAELNARKAQREADAPAIEKAYKEIVRDLKRKNGIRESRKVDQDYIQAVNEGDMETVRKMVELVAAEHGYKIRVKHGTNAFGFTKIDTSMSDDGYSFWVAVSERTSATYTDYGRVREIGSEISYEDIEEYQSEIDDEINEAIDNFCYVIAKTFNEWVLGYDGERTVRMMFDNASYQIGNGDGVYDALIDIAANGFYDAKQYGDFDEYDDFADFQESKEFEKIETAIIALEGLKNKLADSEYPKGGIYDLYINGDNLLVIDGEGNRWDELRPSNMPSNPYRGAKNAPYTTREIARWAREKGYDGVHFKRIVDTGNYGGAPETDVYALFNPIQQVKSADPVTYDDNGEIIPLSERFQPSNKDIRWSRRKDVNIEKINPTEIVPVNEVKDKEKYDYLVSSFRENGWNGRPIVVVDVGNEYRALTGSHRIYAAREADIDVDAIVIPYSESVQELLDARDDYELASAAEKLVKEGAISKSVGDLISREDELNNENYGISPKDQIRYSRKEPDIEGRRIQKTAKYSAERVFTLTEARRVLDNVLSTAVAETLDDMDYSFSSSKASKEDVAKVFWKNLNTATDEEVQKKVALDMADYAIRNLTAEAVYTDEETEGRSNAIPRLDAYSTLFGVIDRKGTVLKKNIKALLETMPLDQVKNYLADAGITIEAETEADAVEEIWKKYKADVDTLSGHIRQTLDSLGEETVAKMKQEIADSIVEQYRKNGKRSTARSMIDYAFDVARKWHDRLVEANRLNKVEDQWERQMRSKTAKGNVQYFVDRELASSKDDPTLSEQLTTFKDAVNAIYSEVNTKTKLHSRARSLEIIRSSAARILAWFENTNNPVVQYLKDAGDYDSVRDLISSVANLGTIDADSLKMALNMVKVITHIAEFANTVYVDNKRFDITEQAYKYNVIADTTMSVPSKFRNWLLNTWYKYTGRFSDPSSLFLAADGYDPDGFFSTMYRSFRDASVKAVETLNDLLSPMEDYFKEHKQWYKGLSGRTATINGTEVPMEIAMSFYCTLHRPHAWEGALTAGFAYTDTNGVRHEVKPFMSVGEYREMLKADKENGTTEVADKVNEIMGDISSQMTETDMGYIDLVWDMMDKARALKEKTDITRMGVSNVEQGMYYPIGRDNQNLKIEDDFGEEMQNIRNYSFNKNTVRGANGRLFIKPVTRVVNLHARGMANYANLTMPIENYYKVMNYKVSGTSRSPDRIKDKVQKIWTEALPYMQKYIQDMQGIGTNADTFLSFMRGNFAAAQLGLNPKVLLTQLSSLFAASNILKYKYYTRGFGVGARTKASVLDEHSAVAKMRYEENEAVLAQANLERKAMHTKKGQVREGIRTISEKTTSLIGMMDRNVIRLLYGVCQVQVEAEQGLKVGTEENLKASADLLNRVIFETQQNAYSTERSAAMRSNNELLKTLTMFTADQVKIVGRLIDSIGTVLHLKAEMKAHPGRPGLEERLKQANKQLARSAAALVEVAAFIAMIAALFRKLFRKEEENEAETIAVDFAGNLLGGLPIISDAYDYFTNGYEVSSPQYDMINNTFKAFTDTIGLMDKAANGTLTDNDIAKAVRSTVFSTSQLVGLPVRNAYNVATGITRLVSPEAGLKVDSLFNSQLLAKEFNDAMEKGDGEKAEMIARLIAKERVEGLTEQTEKEYGRLMAEDYNILPPSVGDTVTYDDTEYTLSAAQRKAFKAIQAQADDAISRMIQTKEYKNADDAIKAKAIRWMNQVYYNLAVEDLTGVSIEDKTVLFSRAVDVSKLAIILAQASGIKADTDKEGKQIVGTRKAKIVALLERQTLKAAQKYMILGYLGYKNTTGEQAVRTYIQSLKLTRAQKEKLFSYCGYGD